MVCVGRHLKDHVVPITLLWAGMPFSRPGQICALCANTNSIAKSKPKTLPIVAPNSQSMEVKLL